MKKKYTLKQAEIEIFNLRRAIRYLAQNHQVHVTKRGQNGAPDTTQEYVDNFWINKVDEIIGELK